MTTSADIIKSNLTMLAVAEKYGYEPNRAGFIHCPFHSDKTPSIKLYNEIGRGFYCFGCGAGGSVIDFVMRLFDISFQQALARIAFDFGINIDCPKPTGRELDELHRRQAQQALEQAEREKEYMSKVELHRAAAELVKAVTNPHTDQEAQTKAWALAQLEQIEFWMQEHPWR